MKLKADSFTVCNKSEFFVSLRPLKQQKMITTDQLKDVLEREQALRGYL